MVYLFFNYPFSLGKGYLKSGIILKMASQVGSATMKTCFLNGFSIFYSKIVKVGMHCTRCLWLAPRSPKKQFYMEKNLRKPLKIEKRKFTRKNYFVKDILNF